MATTEVLDAPAETQEAPADIKLHDEPEQLAVAILAPEPEHLEEIAKVNEANDAPAIDVAALQAQLAEAQRTNAQLSTRLDQRNKHERKLLGIESQIREAEGRVDELTGDLKEAKKQVDELQSYLRRELFKVDQPELPFKDPPAAEKKPEPVATAPLPEDPAGKTSLKDIGIAKGILEKLSGADVNTVAELEAYVAAGSLVPGKLKGLAQAGIDKISDKLISFRAANPNPRTAKPETTPDADLVDGQWDRTQFAAGEIAHVDGKGTGVNPHPQGQFLWNSWDAGWQYANNKPGNSVDEKTAYREGCEAAIAGTTLDRNPHVEGSFEHTAWGNGWNATNKQEVEVAPEADAAPAEELDWQAVANQCTEIVELCETVPDAGRDFADDVAEKVEEVQGWIEENQHVTEKQVEALKGWEAGVRAWIH